MNTKYSHKAFPYHGLSFKDRPAKEFEGEIIGSCFYQEALENNPPFDIFPDGIKATFIRCNLDNILIPAGCKVEGGTNKMIKIQNDTNDWELDKDLNPVKPLDKKLNLKPEDIPAKYIREEQINKADWNRTYGTGKIPEKSWFKEMPEIISEETKEVISDVNSEAYNEDKKNGSYLHFDTEPELISKKKAMKKILATDENGKLILDENFKPTILGEEEIDIYKLKGQVTTYTIKGEGKLWR